MPLDKKGTWIDPEVVALAGYWKLDRDPDPIVEAKELALFQETAPEAEIARRSLERVIQAVRASGLVLHDGARRVRRLGATHQTLEFWCYSNL